jgi:hypothetical protein
MEYLFSEPCEVREYFGLRIKCKSSDAFGLVESLPQVVSGSLGMMIGYLEEINVVDGA